MQQHPITTVIRRASQHIERIANARVYHLGMTYRQLLVLAAIEDEPGCSQRQITEMTGIDRTTVHHIIGALEHSGHLEQKRNIKDRRQVALTLTEVGRACTRRGEKILTKFDIDVREIVRTEEKSVVRAMTKLMEARDEIGDDGGTEAEGRRRVDRRPGSGKRLVRVPSRVRIRVVP